MDWTLFATYAAPVVALVAGAAINRVLERRPNLISYLSHASAVAIQDPQGQELHVHVHSVVVRNAGRRAAKNVRLGHQFLPSFSVFPQSDYQVAQLKGGGAEICFPLLVPGDQVTLTYLYQPPLTFAGVNTYTKCDDGFAKTISVLPMPQSPAWLIRTMWFLMGLGSITALYALGQFSRFILIRWRNP